MVEHLVELMAWVEPRAILFALVLPPVIRLVGHWIPEEVFMIAMGVLAARADSPGTAATILGATFASQFVTDQGVYLAGRWLRPRMGRFPRLEGKLEVVTGRLGSSRSALIGLIPARVLPLGRAAWLAGCGVVRIPWPRFVAFDLAALAIHLVTWSGLGWWLAGDVARLAASAELGKLAGMWLAAAILASISAVIVWRLRPAWQPRTVRAIRWAGRSFRGFRDE